MSVYKIRRALLQAFKDGAFDITVAPNNGKYQPDLSTPWAQIFFSEADARAATLGENGTDERVGTLSINLNYPIKDGEAASLVKADQVRTDFKLGTRFSYDGQEVRISKCHCTGPIRLEDGFYTTVVLIEWNARTPR